MLGWSEVRRKRDLERWEAELVERLLANAESWAKSRTLRDYIQARIEDWKGKGVDTSEGSDAARWVAWASKQADWLDPLVTTAPPLAGCLEQCLVTARDDLRSAGDSAGEELVVIGIGANLLWQCWGLHDLGMNGQQFQRRSRIDAGKLLGQLVRDAPVFVDDFGRDHQSEALAAPCFENGVGRPGEEDARHEDAGVDNDFQRRPCTLATAFVTSEGFIPAARA